MLCQGLPRETFWCFSSKARVRCQFGEPGFSHCTSGCSPCIYLVTWYMENKMINYFARFFIISLLHYMYVSLEKCMPIFSHCLLVIAKHPTAPAHAQQLPDEKSDGFTGNGLCNLFFVCFRNAQWGLILSTPEIWTFERRFRVETLHILQWFQDFRKKMQNIWQKIRKCRKHKNDRKVRMTAKNMNNCEDGFFVCEITPSQNKIIQIFLSASEQKWAVFTI